jgi:quercetin dioxygenase-like cupin family protein
MKVKKKSYDKVPREDAHSGEGGRRLYVDKGELSNKDFEAMTCGYLPAGSKFSWHKHEDVEEVMLVLKGDGFVRDKGGEYSYNSGDLFIFPSNEDHEIENTSDYENEFVFVRVRVDEG